MNQGLANVAQLAEFDEIIDTRSPSEFGEDHVPGAVNCPALNDVERARIGTLYKQDSPFAARKAGAALVARNIACCLEERFADRGREWRPLIYCWRGGKRSGAFVTVFRQIGWDACQLEGGYKSYRRFVVAELERLPARFRFRIVSGATGSGKSRLLQALAAQGAQALDLVDSPTNRRVVVPADKLAYVEIAAALEVPVSTVRSRLHEAIRRLRVRLSAPA